MLYRIGEGILAYQWFLGGRILPEGLCPGDYVPGILSVSQVDSPANNMSVYSLRWDYTHVSLQRVNLLLFTAAVKRTV